jgi:hypothetical protein
MQAGMVPPLDRGRIQAIASTGETFPVVLQCIGARSQRFLPCMFQSEWEMLVRTGSAPHAPLTSCRSASYHQCMLECGAQHS